MLEMNRRNFLQTGALAAAGTAFAAETKPHLTRGIVLYPFDLSLADWPERCAKAGINTIGLHAARRLDVLIDYIQSDAGQSFLSRCAKLGIAVEYELHAMGELLSRELYYKDPTLFRMDENGRRNPDSNCNPFSRTALDIIAEKAVHYAKILKPTTRRYFYWPDDGAKWDESPEGKTIEASDQALLVENHILDALRREVDPQALLSHISYHHTLAAPKQVRPAAGIFLEFAPIVRDYARPINDREAKTRQSHGKYPDPNTNRGYLDILETNMKLFGAEQTQVLEYWLDVSMFSQWKRPAKKLPWNEQVCRADIAAYRKLGVKHITTFATYIDADYVKIHGDPQPVLDQYGKASTL
ncbi:MAG: twin-arginine translocation signal domain-containing protein [Nocardioidaceae bacterium]|nr:twin-arginine translocation signal domain-containing protein [Nocardioidaceae bacterium]